MVGSSRLGKIGPSKQASANRKVRDLLAWLWSNAIQPVLKHLQLLKETESTLEARLWWVTTGLMGLLTLHAAGRGRSAPLEDVYAHIISSYIPSFSALAFARQCQAKVVTESPIMALITMPQTAGDLAQLSTESESQAIRQTFETSDNSQGSASCSAHLIELCQPSAENVLHQIRDNDVNLLHLACHAEPDVNYLANASLLFGSDPTAQAPDKLSVRELRNAQFASRSGGQHPRLAYLSACCTAQQYDLQLIDESIHLATAFQLFGFPAVIGTLWEARDSAAVEIARVFYTELFRLDQAEQAGVSASQSGYRIAKALQSATLAFRQRKIGRYKGADDLLAWAGFVHIGA